MLTLPIAIGMGVWMKTWRPGKVLEASLFGFALLIVALFAGRWAADSSFADAMTWPPNTLVFAMMAYGFVASVLPVWVLLCPRDYLSTFMKVGTISVLGLAAVLLAPTLKMPALNPAYAWAGLGPVVPGTLFPFVFITIACGAASGFHALVSSGTTPKMVSHESEVRPIGYGAC